MARVTGTTLIPREKNKLPCGEKMAILGFIWMMRDECRRDGSTMTDTIAMKMVQWQRDGEKLHQQIKLESRMYLERATMASVGITLEKMEKSIKQRVEVNIRSTKLMGRPIALMKMDIWTQVGSI